MEPRTLARIASLGLVFWAVLLTTIGWSLDSDGLIVAGVLMAAIAVSLSVGSR